jgi:hypothetical protein
LRTFDFNGQLSKRTDLGRVILPADEAALRRLVLKLTREPLSETVQSSPRVDLAFLVDELGVSSLSFLQKVQPLRWKLEADNRARLIDETGADQLVTIDRDDICMPDRRVTVAPGPERSIGAPCSSTNRSQFRVFNSLFCFLGNFSAST